MSYFGKSDFGLEVAKGAVTGHSVVHKFGYNPDVDTATTADIWEFGAVGGNLEYDFPSSDETMYISSSNAGDTGAVYVIVIEGLDQYWLPQSINVQLNGQTPVQAGSGETWMRINRMYSIGTNATAGNIYAANTGDGTAGNGGVPTSTTTVRAYFTIEGQQTQQAIFSVAADTTAYMTDWWTSIVTSLGVAQNIRIDLHVREYESTFRIKQTIELSSSAGPWMHHFRVPMSIPEKSDVLIHALSASINAMQVSAGYGIFLVDNV